MISWTDFDTTVGDRHCQETKAVLNTLMRTNSTQTPLPLLSSFISSCPPPTTKYRLSTHLNPVSESRLQHRTSVFCHKNFVNLRASMVNDATYLIPLPIKNHCTTIRRLEYHTTTTSLPLNHLTSHTKPLQTSQTHTTSSAHSVKIHNLPSGIRSTCSNRLLACF